ncbi:MAG: NAD-dependent epimerase/dehydratase family protein [Alphaproteobacteria bacterium]|nr:MAG: NAD-dependent epimerase/dehydratase family protein [Alphaproteobacteria bacterium]
MPAPPSRFRVLVPGGDGFVGRYLVQALGAALPAGSDILVGTLADAAAEPGAVRRVALDITDAERVRAVLAEERPTHVFHLAAIAAIQTAQHDEQQTWAVNCSGAMNVAAAIGDALPACRLLFCSSAQIYGRSFRDGKPLDENAPVDPIDAYGASKAEADLKIGHMATRGLRAIRLRPFNHTGAGQGRGFVAPDFAAQIAAIERGVQEPVIRVGNLENRRDLMDVRDVVAAYVRAVLRFDDLPNGCAINVASGKAISAGDILNALLALSSATIEVKSDPALMRRSDIPVIRGDAGRARELLDWVPEIPVETTLKSVLDDYRSR